MGKRRERESERGRDGRNLSNPNDAAPPVDAKLSVQRKHHARASPQPRHQPSRRRALDAGARDGGAPPGGAAGRLGLLDARRRRRHRLEPRLRRRLCRHARRHRPRAAEHSRPDLDLRIRSPVPRPRRARLDGVPAPESPAPERRR